MKNKHKVFVALVGISGVLITGISVFANNTTNAIAKNKPTLFNQISSTREMRPHTHLNQLFTNISLSKSQKTEIEKLITEYNSLRKTYQE